MTNSVKNKIIKSASASLAAMTLTPSILCEESLDHKTTESAKTNVVFNLNNDQGEEKNVASENPEIVKHMEELMEEAHIPAKWDELPETNVKEKQPENKNR